MLSLPFKWSEKIYPILNVKAIVYLRKTPILSAKVDILDTGNARHTSPYSQVSYYLF